MPSSDETPEPPSRSVIIDIANPDALRRGGRVILDLADKKRAIQVAQKIALATGNAVTVRDADLTEIHIIPAPNRR
jgi:hypothetical protein